MRGQTQELSKGQTQVHALRDWRSSSENRQWRNQLSIRLGGQQFRLLSVRVLSGQCYGARHRVIGVLLTLVSPIDINVCLTTASFAAGRAVQTFFAVVDFTLAVSPSACFATQGLELEW